MRFCTALSSVILAGIGAFSFAYSMNGYAGIAFALGAAMLVYGICHVICYSIGFRKDVVPETVLVEGLFSVALSLIVLTDLVPAQHIDTYFGAWMIIAGICRMSQALNVSKVNPRNWFAVMPLGLVNTLYGFVMMIPNLLADFDILYIIAVAYILNAFSVAIYTVYMIKIVPSKKAIEAKERAEAKKKQAEEKRKERDRLRSLSRTEREKERLAQRAEKLRKDEEKKASKEARKEARRPASEKTVEFTPQETKEIDDLVTANQISMQIGEEEPAPAPETPDAPGMTIFNKQIPIIEKEQIIEKIEAIKVEEKRAIVNLEKIEDKKPELHLPGIELPEFKLQSEGMEAVHRESILRDLAVEKPKENKEDDLASFTPLTLEELFADERFNIKPLSDQKATETDLKLTQTFTFDWIDTKK